MSACACGKTAAIGSVKCHECREAALRPLRTGGELEELAREAKRLKLLEAKLGRDVPRPIRRTMSPRFMDKPVVWAGRRAR